jgi:radical SAM superfamily enzyme YgiQ (UPF0313 family)
MSNHKTLIYLADLTHTGPVISSNFYPLAVGLVGAYLLECFGEHIDLELFKYPHDLSTALSKQMPQVVGFSNYPWNLNLACEYARRIKQKSPETVIVFGGPNYGSQQRNEMKDFWQRHDFCDFYIVKEGELAMANLLEMLFAADFDVSALKTRKEKLPNCHYLWKNEIVAGEISPRVEPNQIPSPYLTGLMDKFFDTLLVPMVTTARGCPFTCKFCQEGGAYYRPIKPNSNCYAELEYIAKNIKGSHDLFVTDSNFGMYARDIETASIIREISREHGWPKRVELTWGKSRPERVIEAASILKGLTAPVGSVQTTDPVVLENVSRANLSIDVLSAIARSNSNEHDSITEIILGLPGDTFDKHKQTIKDVIEAGFTFLSIYSLSLLKESALNTVDYRRRYQMKTKHRILPRAFGKYSLFSDHFSSVEEGEEICIETDTMPLSDYINSRELDLTIEIIHNGGIFIELIGLCKWLEIPWFDFIMHIYKKRRSLDPQITDLYDYFKKAATKDVWDTPQQLQNDVNHDIDQYLNDELGTNECVACKSVAQFRLLNLFHEILYGEIEDLAAKTGPIDNPTRMYIRQLKQYSRLKKNDILNYEARYHEEFTFDFMAIQNQNFLVNPGNYILNQPVPYTFYHDDEQRIRIIRFIKEYGTSINALGRMTRMRSHFRTLFRRAIQV